MHRSVAKAVVLLVAIVRVVSAQSVETPIPFDSAGRVMAITPILAERLQIQRSALPVTGDYREMRLYAVQPAGGFTLVVHRSTGALERTSLTAEQRDALRDAVDAGMAAAGRPTAESGSTVISEPAGFTFARDQALLGLTLYGPLAASLTDGDAGAGAAYLLAAGGSFFISYGTTESHAITRAQNDLATHLAVDAAGEATLLAYASTSDFNKGARAVTLGAAVAGSMLGIAVGRTMSDAESHAATAGVTMTGLTSWGLAAAVGGDGRTMAGAAAAGGILGYWLGFAYPRQAAYTVTAGDVSAVYTAGLLGAGVGALAIADAKPSKAVIGAVLAPTYVVGALLGDRLMSMPYDLTIAQGRLLQVGATAGALMGLAFPVLANTGDAAFTVGSTVAGGIIGTALTFDVMQPSRAGSSGLANRAPNRGRDSQRGEGLHVSLAPAMVGVLSRAPGRYPLLEWRF